MKTILVNASSWPVLFLSLVSIFRCFQNSRSHDASEAVFVRSIWATIAKSLNSSIFFEIFPHLYYGIVLHLWITEQHSTYVCDFCCPAFLIDICLNPFGTGMAFFECIARLIIISLVFLHKIKLRPFKKLNVILDQNGPWGLEIPCFWDI